MKTLVTGGAGFIGSELTRQLVTRGDEVVIVDNLANGKKENVADVLSERCRMELTDIRDTDALAGHLAGVDVVYHLACLGVRHSIHSPVENHEINASATLQLLIAARAARISRFVYVSSSEVYGTARWAPMTEEYPPSPMTVYGASKLAGECYARAFHRTYGFPTVILRPFNSFGPRCHHEGDSGEVIPKFLLRALAGQNLKIFGNGEQTRDFTNVRDTARGILLGGVKPGLEGETINLGFGQEVSVNELARQILAIVEDSPSRIVHDKPRPGDVLRLLSDTSKARSLLGYEPEISLAEGLRQLKAWYLSQSQTPEELLESEIPHNWEIKHSHV
jgi:UDP-glucose 4-epimerase